MMRRAPVGARSLAATLLLCSLSAAVAEAPVPPTRTLLQRADVAPSPAQETLFATVDIAPGAGNPFHTHFGTEMAYVVTGHIRLDIKGEPSRTLGPGDSFLVARGKVHRSVIIGNEPVRLVNSWTVDKGKPLLTPAEDK